MQSTDKINIAYFTSVYPSLTETFIQREIDYITHRNFSLVVFAVKRPKKIYHRKSERGVIYSRPDNYLLSAFAVFYMFLTRPRRFLRCISIIFSTFQYLPILSTIKLFYHFYTACGFSLLLKKYNIHHVHAHFSTASNIALLANMLVGISFSWTAHASGDIYYKPNLLMHKLNKAKFVIAISQYNKRYLNLLSDYHYNKQIKVIYNGVAIPKSLVKSYNNTHGIKLLSVGSFTYFKGYPTLIDALSKLTKLGYDWCLSIIGDGPQRPVIEQLIHDNNLEKYIKLLGPKDNETVLSKMYESDIFILASEIYVSGIRDGMPTVLTEAMSLGLPVISTYVSGIPELIEHEVSGLLVPENNPKKLLEAIVKLISNPELRKSLGNNAHSKVVELFDINKTMEQYFEIIRENIKV